MEREAYDASHMESATTDVTKDSQTAGMQANSKMLSSAGLHRRKENAKLLTEFPLENITFYPEAARALRLLSLLQWLF